MKPKQIVAGSNRNTSGLLQGQQGSGQPGSAIRWKKPEAGRYKCNVDASFSHHRNRVGFDMCNRDDEGGFVLAKTMWSSPICNVDRCR
jgi:hypothetical protein